MKQSKHLSGILLTVALLPGMAWTAGASAGISTFDSNAEGWTITGDAQGGSFLPTYHASGGNPGGYISATDDVLGRVSARGATVDLTDPDWIITGFDTVNWNGSLLFFTEQTPTGLGFDIGGYADWYSNGTFRGRELFSGTMSESLFLDFTGYQLVDPVGIILAHYTGTVTTDGQNIINGAWQGLSGFSNGVWSATRVPEPSSVALLGVASLAVMCRRKKRVFNSGAGGR